MQLQFLFFLADKNACYSYYFIAYLATKAYISKYVNFKNIYILPLIVDGFTRKCVVLYIREMLGILSTFSAILLFKKFHSRIPLKMNKVKSNLANISHGNYALVIVRLLVFSKRTKEPQTKQLCWLHFDRCFSSSLLDL